MTEDPADLFTCVLCWKTFPKGWTEEEAMAEFKRDFPDAKQADAMTVCNDCYEMMEAKRKAAMQ